MSPQSALGPHDVKPTVSQGQDSFGGLEMGLRLQPRVPVSDGPTGWPGSEKSRHFWDPRNLDGQGGWGTRLGQSGSESSDSLRGSGTDDRSVRQNHT